MDWRDEGIVLILRPLGESGAVVTREEPVICGGMMMLYVDLCQAFGLEARYVGLYLADNTDSHASVEVNLGGRWFAIETGAGQMAWSSGGGVSSGGTPPASRAAFRPICSVRRSRPSGGALPA